MSRFLPVGKGVKGAAGFLLAAIPALGAVLTGLAITGGLVGHMARDHPLASYGAFGLAVQSCAIDFPLHGKCVWNDN